ncbi:MAG: hypothetical protein F2825_02240 [Actinobacteria bacterium]|uniref:Unannotated protein n=1 Tax=freshwater metagenome TaxID=449393 RepID=A0A6J7GI02_9ZZZZ|nr:hypothetical protein [Actinomycetota bacterium]
MRRVRTRRRSGPARSTVALPSAGAGAAARAWCGPGHGQEWTSPPGEVPADVVELATAADGNWSYRLVLHPVTQRPARDHHGRLVYLPVVRLPGSAVHRVPTTGVQ